LSRIKTRPPQLVERPCLAKCLRHHLQEDITFKDHEDRIRVEMYPSYVHTDINAMVPRCTTADLDLQDALDSPTKETWILNHHKLRCLACLWSPSDRQRTGSPELDNKSDFFFITKYGQGLLPENMYLVLCSECMHSTTWTSFPVTKPKLIQFGTMDWKLAPTAPCVLYGQKPRPIKPAGVKPEPKKTPPNEDPTVPRSPLSNLTHNLNKIDSMI
jgi:hypothetical protein